jgi:hydrogenase maturation protein HypF
MGRLIDAVAALIGVRQRASFEGQAAMELEFACDGITTDRWYPFKVSSVTIDQGANRRIIEWNLVIEGILADLNAGFSSGEIAATFHNTLVEIIVTLAGQYQIEQVILSGGCFQNKYLLESSINKLRKAGFRPYWSQKFPANDGGIALGQIAAAQREYSWRVKNVSSSSR